MANSQIAVSFEFPDDDDFGPFINIDTMYLHDAAIAQGCPESSPLLNLIHQAGGEVDFEELIKLYLEGWEPSSRRQAAIELADWFELLAARIRRKGEAPSLDLKPVMSPRM
ncbi:hypothetical protein AAH995_08475 [Pseudomonas putida]|uniref:hypothetical protein n=1 Tax=Pseudomonas putida TaxID=303 RepID=UPI00349E5515